MRVAYSPNTNGPIEDVYPNKRASVVVLQNGEHVVRENWGTNFRSPNNSRWKPWLGREHRCIVPASAFAEPDKNTSKGNMMWRWFTRADKLPFFFAGIWRPWTGDRGTKRTPNVLKAYTVFNVEQVEGLPGQYYATAIKTLDPVQQIAHAGGFIAATTRPPTSPTRRCGRSAA